MHGANAKWRGGVCTLYCTLNREFGYFVKICKFKLQKILSVKYCLNISFKVSIYRCLYKMSPANGGGVEVDVEVWASGILTVVGWRWMSKCGLVEY